jgi:formate C-acetyltransferase
MGATFDGRRAGRAFSDGCGPVQGRDVNGITALIGSLTSWDQSALLGGMVVNLKFTKKILETENHKVIAGIIRTFMKRGGIELQINTVDRATLEDAVKNPELHSELLVRVGGYSDYFVRLSPTLQKEIIDRTEY